jgi:hypothetical protein
MRVNTSKAAGKVRPEAKVSLMDSEKSERTALAGDVAWVEPEKGNFSKKKLSSSFFVCMLTELNVQKAMKIQLG